MSLENAHAAFRAELQAHRSKQELFAALETALTAKQELAKIEQQRQATMAAIDTATAKRLQIEQALSGKQSELDDVAAKITAAQADLKALNASISDTKRAWEAEQKAREETQRKASANLDAVIEEKQAALRKLKDELAAVVAGYQAAAGSEA